VSDRQTTLARPIWRRGVAIATRMPRRVTRSARALRSLHTNTHCRSFMASLPIPCRSAMVRRHAGRGPMGFRGGAALSFLFPGLHRLSIHPGPHMAIALVGLVLLCGRQRPVSSPRPRSTAWGLPPRILANTPRSRSIGQSPRPASRLRRSTALAASQAATASLDAALDELTLWRSLPAAPALARIESWTAACRAFTSTCGAPDAAQQ